MVADINGIELNDETAGEGFGDRAPRFAETALSFLRGDWKRAS